MVNKTLMDMLDATVTGAARAARRVNSLESTRHLRNSGAELLRAVRASLDDVIEVLDPAPEPAKADSSQPKVD